MFACPKVFSRSTTSAAITLALYLSTPGVQAQTASVTVPAEALFLPAELRVTPGTEVVWTFYGHHDVVQTTGDNCERLDGGFDSGWAHWANLGSNPAPTFSLRFDEPGIYYYMCSPHCEDENQKGVIIVAEPDNGETTDGQSTSDGETSGGEITSGSEATNGETTNDSEPTSANTNSGTDAEPTNDGEPIDAGEPTSDSETADDDTDDAGAPTSGSETTEDDKDTPTNGSETTESVPTSDSKTTNDDTDDAGETSDDEADERDTGPEDSGNDGSSCSCHLPGRATSSVAFGAFALVGLALLRRRSTQQ